MFEICEVIEEHGANWIRQDPAVAIETQADNLRKLKALYIDCGKNDLFNLLYGCPALRAAAERARRSASLRGVLGQPHCVDYRMDESLPFLALALSG